jgi:hypothetical protein
LWVSPIFFVPKPDGTFRKIIDTSALNAFLFSPYFRMEDHRLLFHILQPKSYAVTLDIKNAYHHIRVSDSFSYFLCFAYGGRYYRYVGMPFGVSPAPYVFSSIMHQCIAAVRRIWSVVVIFYLDDLLFLHADPLYLRQAIDQICTFLSWLGWIINHEKSVKVPSQRFRFLGWFWDSIEMTLRLPDTKVALLRADTLRLARAARARESWTPRELAVVIGRLSATRLQHQQASLHLCLLNALNAAAVQRSGWDGVVHLTPAVLSETDWWLQMLLRNEPRSLVQLPPQATIYTDASPTAWGARVLLHPPHPLPQSEIFLQGLWRAPQSSNYLELDAVRLALSSLLRQPHIPPLSSIVIRSDNTPTCFNINRQAAGPNLRIPLQRLLNFARHHHLQLRARHVPGLANDAADRLSRLSAAGDYRINRRLIHATLQRLGISISVDLFASSSNTIHPVFFSFKRDARAAGQDAFATPWHRFRFPFIHPPLPLIPRVLRRLQLEKMQAVLIVPLWRDQAWFPILLSMAKLVVDLGPADRVLVRGPAMQRRRNRLLPGNVALVVVDSRTIAPLPPSLSPASLLSSLLEK